MPPCGMTTTLAKYSQVVNYLLRTYETDKDIVGTDNEITMFTQPPNKTPLQYVEELVEKALRREDVYGKHDLNEIFIKRLDKSTKKTTRCYWDTRQSVILLDSAFHATSLLKLQGGRQGLSTSHVGVKSRNRETMWQSRSQLVNVITSSETGLISIGQESMAD